MNVVQCSELCTGETKQLLRRMAQRRKSNTSWPQSAACLHLKDKRCLFEDKGVHILDRGGMSEVIRSQVETRLQSVSSLARCPLIHLQEYQDHFTHSPGRPQLTHLFKEGNDRVLVLGLILIYNNKNE